jgi:hypothetical protein
MFIVREVSLALRALASACESIGSVILIGHERRNEPDGLKWVRRRPLSKQR